MEPLKDPLSWIARERARRLARRWDKRLSKVPATPDEIDPYFYLRCAELYGDLMSPMPLHPLQVWFTIRTGKALGRKRKLSLDEQAWELYESREYDELKTVLEYAAEVDLEGYEDDDADGVN